MRNWAGNYEYGAARVHRPQWVREIQALVADATKVKALGSRHSFNDIADSPIDLISMENFFNVVALDRDRRTVIVEGGVKYGDLCRYLDTEGFALHNLASLPHISVAGAVATATHGSGERNGNLSTAVSGLEIVTADGDLLSLERGDDAFNGAVVGLGAVGIVTLLTLDLQPAFQVWQTVYENLPWESLESHFDAIEGSGYSVSLFTDWQGEHIDQVWVKQTEGDIKAELFGAKKADGDRHPIGEISPVNCTPQMGVPGPSFERLPHFRMDFTPSSGEELQSEYFVPRAQALDALREIKAMSDRIAPLLLISEIRAIAADELWMSPCYHQDSIGIHFTWKQDWDGVRQVLPMIEERLAPFKVRPHWGKLFTMPADRLTSLYERWPDFWQLLQSYDPLGKYRNAFLDRNLPAGNI